jgi:hypothetical protein
MLMRVPDRAAVTALLLAVATACSAPRNGTTVARADAPVTAISSAAPGTSTAAAGNNGGATATATSGAAAGVDANLVREGYRVVRRHDQILYCRSQSVTGTLFASTVCLTASQIASQKHELQQSKDLLNQGRATQCVGPECVDR